MSRTYNPDNWVVLKISDSKGFFYKVLGGWSGGYLSGNSWRLNSGVSDVIFEDGMFFFYGASGSCYECHSDSYGLKMNNAHVVELLQSKQAESGVIVQLMPEDTEWVGMDLGDV